MKKLKILLLTIFPFLQSIKTQKKIDSFKIKNL